MQKVVQVTVIGKVLKPNKQKILALNSALDRYFQLVRWYLSFNSTSKMFLHRNGYEKAKRFNLNTALIQTARDKAVEMLKSFEENKKVGSLLRPNRISMRFDRRCYCFYKTSNVLTPYWITLSLKKMERISLPLVFGERQRLIEEALKGGLEFAAVEMVKRGYVWYAHLILKKTVELTGDHETVIAIDRGERNLAVAVALSKSSLKPAKGQFWSGAEIKRIRGLYGHIRRRLEEKKLLGKIKSIKGKERRKVNQQLHIMVNQIVKYAKQFPNPVLVMEDLRGIRKNFKRSRKLDRRFHSVPFRKLQTCIEHKANLEGMTVRYLTKEETRNTSKTCHRCGHVAEVKGRIYRCNNCGMEYDRDLNAAINIAHRLMWSMGWRSSEPLGLVYDGLDVKSPPNAGSSRLSWSSSQYFTHGKSLEI